VSKRDDQPSSGSLIVAVTRFGGPTEELEVLPDEVIHFPKGIVGFEELKRYVLVADPDCPPFFWIQSVDDPAIGFAVVDSRFLMADYTVDLADELIGLLDLKDPADASIWVILTLAMNPQDITANLLAPIVINYGAARGLQLIQHNRDYPIRHPLVVPDAAVQDLEAESVKR